MTLLTWGLVFLAFLFVTAMFAFGLLRTSFQGTARILFYVFLMMLIGTVVVSLVKQPGYDPTPTHQTGE